MSRGLHSCRCPPDRLDPRSIMVAEKIIDSDEQNLRLVRTATAGGTATDIDVATARSQLDHDRGLLPPLRQQLAAMQDAMATLVGKSIGRPFGARPSAPRHPGGGSTTPCSECNHRGRDRRSLSPYQSQCRGFGTRSAGWSGLGRLESSRGADRAHLPWRCPVRFAPGGGRQLTSIIRPVPTDRFGGVSAGRGLFARFRQRGRRGHDAGACSGLSRQRT
jgi:hypothetical protein